MRNREVQKKFNLYLSSAVNLNPIEEMRKLYFKQKISF